MITTPSTVMGPYVCLVFCRHQKGKSLRWAVQHQKETRDVSRWFLWTQQGGPVPESWAEAGAGAGSIPLRKAHVAHKWGQKDLEGAAQGQPRSCRGIPVLCSKGHRCRDTCDRRWKAHRQQRAPAEMAREWGLTRGFTG